MSAEIQHLLQLAKHRGLQFQEGGWSKADVFWSKGPMPEDVRAAGHASPNLEYHKVPEMPWTCAYEHFFDPKAKVAIVFEIEQ